MKFLLGQVQVSLEFMYFIDCFKVFRFALEVLFLMLFAILTLFQSFCLKLCIAINLLNLTLILKIAFRHVYENIHGINFLLNDREINLLRSFVEILHLKFSKRVALLKNNLLSAFVFLPFLLLSLL